MIGVGGGGSETKVSGNFGPRLNGSVQSNWKSFEKTGPLFEMDHFSWSDWLEFWLNGSYPIFSLLSLLTLTPTPLILLLFILGSAFPWWYLLLQKIKHTPKIAS